MNRAFQGFLVGAYGRDLWDLVRRDAGFDFEDFEPMLTYEPALTTRLVKAAARRLEKPGKSFMEDVGTWMIANPDQSAIRRLMRFGGEDYREFLFSLDELPDRAKMAVPHLEVPEISLEQKAPNQVDLLISWPKFDLSAVALGALRAMADDYGALVLLTMQATGRLSARIEVELLDVSFSEGRSFSLSGA
ncbi:MAG: heme NO-binding domain-containing protein [Pseudomonadota bacterium]